MRTIKRIKSNFNSMAKFLFHLAGSFLFRPWIGKPDPRLLNRAQSLKILYVCLAYRGDLVVNFPAIDALKRHFPSSHLTCWVRGYNESLARMNTNIDEVMVYDVFGLNPLVSIYEIAAINKHPGIIQKLHEFDIYIDDSGYAFTAITGFRAKIPLRLGRNFQGFGFLNHFEFPLDPNTQLINRRLKLLGVFGIALTLNDISKPYFRVDTTMRVLALNEHGLSGSSYFTVQPFAGWEAKNWGIDKYCRVSKQFAKDTGLTPVFLGSHSERVIIEKMLDDHQLEAVNIAGLAPLDKVAAVIAGARLHFGADSVGSQLAISLGIRSLTIFGPANPMLCSYLGGVNFGIIKRTKCTPRPNKLYCCFDAGRSCPYISCMKELREDDVLRALTDVWKGKAERPLIEL